MTMARRGRVLETVFDPLTEVTPLFGVWAQDHPGRWTRPADGALVPSWPAIGGTPASNGTAGQQPTVRYNVAAFGGRSTVEATTAGRLLTAATGILNQPFKTLTIGRITTVGASNAVFFGFNNSGTGLGRTSTGLWFYSAGTSVPGSASNTNPHSFRSRAAGGASYVNVDGVNVVFGNINVGPFNGHLLFAGPGISSPMLGDIHFHGVYADATSDTLLDALEVKLRAFCGI